MMGEENGALFAQLIISAADKNQNIIEVEDGVEI